MVGTHWISVCSFLNLNLNPYIICYNLPLPLLGFSSTLHTKQINIEPQTSLTPQLITEITRNRVWFSFCGWNHLAQFGFLVDHLQQWIHFAQKWFLILFQESIHAYFLSYLSLALKCTEDNTYCKHQLNATY